jgi:hypothetical protein
MYRPIRPVILWVGTVAQDFSAGLQQRLMIGLAQKPHPSLLWRIVRPIQDQQAIHRNQADNHHDKSYLPGGYFGRLHTSIFQPVLTS